MPFDPNLPVNHAKLVAAELRGQFNGLFDLIQSIPAGPQGEPGTPGVSVTGAVVDGVTTVNPWDPATASASFDGSLVHFAFGLPRGNDGAQGPQGNNGFDGPQGPQGWPGPAGEPGPPGPPFTSFMVDGVTTLPPADPAWVQSTFDGTWVRFTFGIPRGHNGLPGPAGQNGADGAPGQTGSPFTSFTARWHEHVPARGGGLCADELRRIFEIPSNFIQHCVGARIWNARAKISGAPVRPMTVCGV